MMLELVFYDLVFQVVGIYNFKRGKYKIYIYNFFGDCVEYNVFKYELVERYLI